MLGSVRIMANRLPIFILCCLLLSVTVYSAAEIDTSIVQLNINGKKISDSFEIIDMWEYVLLPISSLAKLLDANAELFPNTLIAEINRQWDGTSTSLDLQNGDFVYGPIADFGDFFVPISTAQEIFAVQFNWNPLSQILEITTERELSMFASKTKPDTTKPNDLAVADSRQPDKIAPPVSIGSVQYLIEKQESSDINKWPEKDNLTFDLHAQACGIPIDIKGHSDQFLTSQREWYLDRITATHRTPTMELVLGDTTFNLSRIVDNTQIRGLSYTSPPDWTSRQLRAYTTIEGYVTPGSDVELMINGYYYGRVTTEDGHYLFENVPLQIIQANTVEITTIEEDGTRSTETRVISATPRLLPKGKIETALGGGWIRDDGEQNNWLSAIYGGAAYAGVTNSLTIGGEYARKNYLDQPKPDQSAGNVGLALRATDNLLFSLDWMVSRPEDNSGVTSQGAELTATFSERLFAIQSIIFYKEPGLVLFTNESSNVQGYQVISEYQISKSLGIEVSYQQTKPVDDGSADPMQNIIGTLRWLPNARNSAVFKWEREIEVSDVAELDYRHTSPSSELDFNFRADWTKNNFRQSELRSLRSQERMIHAVGKSVYTGIGRSDQIDWWLAEPYAHKASTDFQITWFPWPYRLVGSAAVDEFRELNFGNRSLKEIDLSIDLSKTIGVFTIGSNLGLLQTYRPALTDKTLRASGYLRGASRDGKFFGQLKVQHQSPLYGTNLTETVTTSVSTGVNFSNGMTLTFEGGTERSKASETEYYVALSLSQGIGFSNDGIRGFKASMGRPLSYIDGVVYIDQNSNGKRDPSEQTVPGVPVTLDGRRKVTNEDGYYCFEYVSSGVYSIGLDMNTLPADYTPKTERKLIKLPSNANYTQDFAVTLNGTVEGTVFYDYNKNGKLDEDEQTLDWVKLILDDNTTSFTDRRGDFTFQNVNLGQHTLTIDPESLPAMLAVPPPTVVEITTEELDVWDLLIPLQLASD